MADHKVEYPTKQEDSNIYEFTSEELAEIQKHVSKYPDKQSAVMPALWIAQEKWNWLPQGAIQLVADTLQLSYAHVYGVATFYTMYLKENKAKYMLEICTCFSCGECGGYDLMNHAKKSLKLNDEGVSPDKMFFVREAECLGACDTAVVMQVHNRRIIHNLTPNTFDSIVDDLRNGKYPEYVPVPLKNQNEINL